MEQELCVAVCDQVQATSEVRGGAIVERGVSRVFTPGTLVDDGLLRVDAPSLLGAVCFTGAGDDSPAAAAVVDFFPGRFDVFECSATTVADELSRRDATELLYADTADGRPPPRVARLLEVLRLAGTPQPDWHCRPDEAREALAQQLGVSTLVGFGLGDQDSVVQPAGAVTRYLRHTQLPEVMVIRICYWTAPSRDTRGVSASRGPARDGRNMPHVSRPCQTETASGPGGGRARTRQGRAEGQPRCTAPGTTVGVGSGDQTASPRLLPAGSCVRVAFGNRGEGWAK